MADAMEEERQVLSGLQAVREALRCHRRPLYALWLHREEGAGDLAALAKEAGVPVRKADAHRIGELAGAKSQGVALECGPIPLFTMDELLRFEPAGGRDLIVLLDGVEDPRNLGAVARSASFLGARALVLPGRGTAPLSPSASRTSAGALETLPVAVVPRLGPACGRLVKAGFFLAGLESGGVPITEWREIPARTALVLGGEDRGLSPQVREHCHGVFTIPGAGPTGSLNVSVAAGIALFYIFPG